MTNNTNDFPQQMYDKVQRLLDSDITANKIQVETGVDRGIISRLRNNKAKISNLRFSNIIVLYNYANKYPKLKWFWVLIFILKLVHTKKSNVF